eukprot:gene5080-biopygen22148
MGSSPNSVWACRTDFPTRPKRLLQCGGAGFRIFVAKENRAHPRRRCAKTVARIIVRVSLERRPQLSLQQRLRGSEYTVLIVTAEHDEQAEVELFPRHVRSFNQPVQAAPGGTGHWRGHSTDVARKWHGL